MADKDVQVWREGSSGEPSFPDKFKVLQKAVLQVTDIQTNRNKYYAVELHEAGTKYRVYTHYGRTDDLDTNPNAGIRECRYPVNIIHAQNLYDKIYKEKTSELKMSFASVRARLEDWEKRQDRITLLLLKSQDLTQNLERRARLYEVLGKDELRTFVLSLVEENLITQTNDELQKLCQGRYEIVHQSRRMKLTPEFYILDKFREGGLRKVSTLSGGETFMVSLAMALGLAEMTRGKAEIDTLFIDEGFGTLDHESLEDVLDMLKQIQTRGLMVGIISHVKELTQALPVNLQVTKKQDGTSSIGLQYN